MYGEDFKDMPKPILDQIYDILVRLYLECDIEYIDITPYNFIEKDDKVWIIDFGDAQEAPKKDWFLNEVFKNRTLTEWNIDFR
jgi:serine/threonine-protein kinase RIO1